MADNKNDDSNLTPKAFQENSSNNPSTEQELTKKERIIREVKNISIIVVLVFVFRSVCFEPFRIPSGSMIPTLLIGDFILVNKMAYGYKVPFSDWIGDPIYLSTPKLPERGEVIVFKYPKDTSLNYIKRVIGLPGDTLEMRDKIVYINGNPVIPLPIDGKNYMDDMDDKFKSVNLKFFRETLGSNNHVYQIDSDSFVRSDFEKIVIPKDQFFVMGDNRDFSADSRYWGFVPFNHIKGRALFVWFSMIIPGEYDFKFRPWRIGTSIK